MESAVQLQARLNELQGIINTIVVNKIAFVAAGDPNAQAAAEQQAQMAAQQQGGQPAPQDPAQQQAMMQQQAAMQAQQQDPAAAAQQQAMMEQQAMAQQQQAAQEPQGQPAAPQQGNPVEQQLAELMQAVNTIADEFGKLQQQVEKSAKEIEGFTKTATELKVQFGAMEKVIVKLQHAIEEPPAPMPAPQMEMPKEPPAPPAPNGPTIHLH